jgi:hypothetical protein
MRRSTLIAAGLLAFGALAAQPVAASAAEYGAIAYDVASGHIGYSWHGPTVANANAAALSACGMTGCRIVIEIGPGLCGALATAPNPAGWGAASRSTRADAELGAMADCQRVNYGVCRVQSSDCNQ